MFNICIVNAHWSNRGDEAALRPLINVLTEKYPSASITIIFKDKNEIQQFPYMGNIHQAAIQFLPDSEEQFFSGKSTDVNMQKEMSICMNSDMMIYAPGGAVISDKFWWRKQLEYLLPFVIAKEHNIPIVVAAPSMGGFEGSRNEHKNLIRRKYLNAASAICVREAMSAEYLRRIGVCNNVVTTIDTAFYDDPNEAACQIKLNADFELTSFLSKYEKIIGMTLSDFSWHVKLAKETGLSSHVKEVVCNFLEEMRKENIGVLLIPQLFGNQNDEKYLQNFVDVNTFVLSDRYDTYVQQYVVSKLYALIGMRYHSNIFAAKMGTPFIAIGYEEKMIGFMRDWNLDEYMIALEDLSVDALNCKWQNLTKNYNEIRKFLKDNRELWRKKAKETIDTVLDVIDSKKLETMDNN